MKTVKKGATDTDVCPNCGQELTVPKSTRSFICRFCDAVLKVVEKEDGVELKVVGKSVDEDPDYQSLEARIADLKLRLDELHTRYGKEMARDHGRAGSRIRNLGVLALLVGSVVAIYRPLAGGVVVLAGLAAVLAGMVVNSARKRAKQAATIPLRDEIDRVGAERDLLQRKAARLKTQV
jgi:hypothetical protein